MRSVLLGGLLVLAALPAAAQTAADMPRPFGFRLGSSVQEAGKLAKLTLVDRALYAVTAPPKPHASFPVPMLYFGGANKELCLVVAQSVPFENDRYGESLQGLAERITDALTEKYGPPSEVVNDIKPGASSARDEQFIESLYYKARNWYRVWELPTGVRIKIVLQADDLTFSSALLGYRLNNAACAKGDKGAL